MKKMFFMAVALSGLLVLSGGSIVFAAPGGSTIVVNSSGLNMAGDGNCTLAEAIANSNGNADFSLGDCMPGSGDDTINFIGPMTITLDSILNITDKVTIDATSVGTCPEGQGVILDVNGGTTALSITVSGAQIKGLHIMNYTNSGIQINGISGTQTTLSCNVIGLDTSGTTAAGGSESVYITNSSDILIGGPNAADRNTFSGNQASTYSQGISIAHGLSTSSNITIEGNYFGVNRSGMSTVPNGSGGEGQGVDIYNTSAANISVLNNLFAGGGVVSDTSTVDGLTIQGNTFDFASDTITLLASSGAHREQGLNLEGVTNFTIGGTNSGESNIFAGVGGGKAIVINDSSNGSIYGNIIGYYPDGETPAVLSGGYRSNSIGIQDSSNINIGSSAVGGGNIIGVTSASAFGVLLNRDENISVVNNHIGLGSDNISTSTTSYGGVIVLAPTGNISIGGTSTNEGNTIAGGVVGVYTFFGPEGLISVLGNTIFNVNYGVFNETSTLLPSADSYVAVRGGNSIRANISAIDMVHDATGDQIADANIGEDANDPGDADTGPNDFMNHPVLISATQSGSDAIVTYMLDVPVSANPYYLEFFTNPSGLLSSGFGPGETYKGSDTQTISSAGQHVFTVTLHNTNVSDGITATVTSCSNVGCTAFIATSEFSNSSTGGVDLATASGNETDLEDGGPYHIVKSGVSLGATIAADTLASIDASDKDGVTFDAGSYLPNATVTATVNVPASGYLNAWFDANGDGDFDDTGEQFATNESLASGNHTYSVTAPATDGSYNIRFRFTSYSAPTLGPGGEALDGEVEDYVVTVATPVAASSGGVVAIFGCSNIHATNYNPNTTVDNNSCLFGTTITPSAGQSTQAAAQPAATGCLPGYVFSPLNGALCNNTSVAATSKFTKTLKLGMTDPEVKLLQQYLNTHNFIISANGAGSPGKETSYFGVLTKLALIKFQEAHKAAILAPLGLEKGTGIFGPSTRAEFMK